MLDTTNIQQVFLYQAEIIPVDARVVILIVNVNGIHKSLICGIPLRQFICIIGWNRRINN